jgi:hypothetical protein
MSDIATQDAADQVLAALGEQLAAAGERYELVVIGGSGLLALGIIERSTVTSTSSPSAPVKSWAAPSRCRSRYKPPATASPVISPCPTSG